jgi:hypothetical protein
MTNEQDRQGTYDVTSRAVRETAVAVEKQYYIFLVRVCSFRYPACNEYARYYCIFSSVDFWKNSY